METVRLRNLPKVTRVKWWSWGCHSGSLLPELGLLTVPLRVLKASVCYVISGERTTRPMEGTGSLREDERETLGDEVSADCSWPLYGGGCYPGQNGKPLEGSRTGSAGI